MFSKCEMGNARAAVKASGCPRAGRWSDGVLRSRPWVSGGDTLPPKETNSRDGRSVHPRQNSEYMGRPLMRRSGRPDAGWVRGAGRHF